MIKRALTSFTMLSLSFFIFACSTSFHKDTQESESNSPINTPDTQNHSGNVPAAQPVPYGKYDHLDPKKIIPIQALKNAVTYLENNLSQFPNQNFMTIIDMSVHSSNKRFYLIDMKLGTVTTYLVAHGKNSDPNDKGYAQQFSNDIGSEMTSLGFYKTGEQYNGSHGISLRLYGLEQTNSNAFDRDIVMHGADYVNSTHTGRSWGCPAVETKYISVLVPLLANGSLMYIWRK